MHALAVAMGWLQKKNTRKAKRPAAQKAAIFMECLWSQETSAMTAPRNQLKTANPMSAKIVSEDENHSCVFSGPICLWNGRLALCGWNTILS